MRVRTTSAKLAPAFCERLADDLQNAPRLLFYRAGVGAYRAGAGDVNGIASAHRAGEADDGLIG
jgi:hypothetical protein